MALSKLLLHKNTGDNNHPGWQKITPLTTEIISEIQEDVSSANRASTSVPSPLARIFSFNTALQSMYEWKKFVQDNVTESEKKRNFQILLNSSNNASLVSELLDVLEWIYQEGYSGFNFNEKFEVTFGNSDTIGNDKLSTKLGITPGMKCLSSALKYACDHSAFGNKLDITFLLYDNNLVGGTSPFTVIYTAPNFKEYGKSLNISVNKRDNNPRRLFENTCPLEERSTDFQAYVKWLVNEVFDKQSAIAVEAERPIFYFQKYVDLAVTTNANSGENARDVPICTDYTLRTTNNAENGEAIYTHMAIDNFAGKVVLLLSDDSENDDLVFFKGDKWSVFKGKLNLNNAFVRINDILIKDAEGNDVLARKVSDTFPNTHGENYTFVTVLDLFNDKIIKSSKQLNNNHFYTINVDNSLAYFIPVTPLFIKLFKKEGVESLIFQKDTDGNIIVSFTHRNIKVSKTYYSRDVYDFQSTFDMSIFPSKKYLSSNENQFKDYFIQVITAKGDDFKPQNSITVFSNDIDLNQKEDKDFKEPRGVIDHVNSFHFNLKDAFEFLEINIEGNKAIIYPKWVKRDYYSSNILHYGIDFGTSNTHVAFFQFNNSNSININQIKDIELDNLTLRFSTNLSWNDFTTSEFIPANINGNSTIKFPFETILLHINEGEYETFSQSNIGFNRDEKYLKGVKYDSNLKWEVGEGATNRNNKISNFFKELLLLLKLHTLENNGNVAKTVFHFTYPITLGFEHIDKVIKTVLHEIFGSEVGIKILSESEAPIKALGPVRDDFINIDIGGGSTDMYYRYTTDTNPKGVVCGGKLAGNDLFGNSPDADQNGLLKYFVEKYVSNTHLKLDNKITPYIEKWKNFTLKDIDLANLLLKKNGELNLSNVFIEKPAFKAGLLLHLTAVIHYLTKVIYDEHNGELDDKTFSFFFTGNGSKYLNILGNDEINGIVDDLFIFCLIKIYKPDYILLGNSDENNYKNFPNIYDTIKTEIISSDLDKKQITVNGSLLNFRENKYLNIPKAGGNGGGGTRDKGKSQTKKNDQVENKEIDYLFTNEVEENTFKIRAAIKKDIDSLMDVYKNLLDTRYKDILNEINNIRDFNDINSIIDALIVHPDKLQQLAKPYYFEVVKRIIHNITSKLAG